MVKLNVNFFPIHIHTSGRLDVWCTTPPPKLALEYITAELHFNFSAGNN